MTRPPLRTLGRAGAILGVATLVVTGTSYGVSSLTTPSQSMTLAAEVSRDQVATQRAGKAWSDRLDKAALDAQLKADAERLQAEVKRQQAEEAKKKAEVEARKKAEAAARKKAERQQAAQRAARAAQRSGNPRSIARAMLSDYGWGSGQFACLDSLWTRESNWNYRARNPYSGAYGIPQALPGRKMAKYGSDWRTNPTTQIKWGLSYIKSTYGTPCGAWSHFKAKNWY